MKIRISFSISLRNGLALGHMDGDLDFPVEPMLGDKICLMLAPNGIPIPSGHLFGGMFTITSRIITPNQSKTPVSLMLEDMIIESKEQAYSIIAYLESAYGLFATIYENVDP